MPILFWSTLLLFAATVAPEFQRSREECLPFSSHDFPPPPAPSGTLSNVVHSLSSGFVKTFCFLYGTEGGKPTWYDPFKTLWQRCANKWGGHTSPAMTLHVVWPKAAFDASHFKEEIARRLSLEPLQVEVTQLSTGPMAFPGLPLIISDVLAIDFVLQNVPQEHITAHTARLQYLTSETTVRTPWRVLGSLIIAGEDAPTSFLDQLLDQVLVVYDSRYWNGFKASGLHCRSISVERALVRDADEDMVVEDGVSGHLTVIHDDRDYTHARWVLLTGNASITDPSKSSTTVSSLGLGRNVFLWVALSTNCSRPDLPACCHALIASVSITRTASLPLAPLPMILRQSWASLQAPAAPCPHSTGMWCTVDGTGDIGEPGTPNTLVTNLTLGRNVLTWVVHYSSSVVKQYDVVIIREPGTDPNVPLALVIPLNNRIWRLNVENERLNREIQARDIMVKEAQELASKEKAFITDHCSKMPTCPIPSESIKHAECPAPVVCDVCPPKEPCPAPPVITCSAPEPLTCPECRVLEAKPCPVAEESAPPVPTTIPPSQLRTPDQPNEKIRWVICVSAFTILAASLQQFFYQKSFDGLRNSERTRSAVLAEALDNIGRQISEGCSINNVELGHFISGKLKDFAQSDNPNALRESIRLPGDESHHDESVSEDSAAPGADDSTPLRNVQMNHQDGPQDHGAGE